LLRWSKLQSGILILNLALYQFQGGRMDEVVHLRVVNEADLPIFFEHQLDPVAYQMAGLPSRDREAYMVHWAKNMRDDQNYNRTILFNGQVVGYIVSFIMEGEREVGYWIGREFWGKGIATQALSLFLKGITTRPLYAHVIKANVGSRRVLENCGFSLAAENDEEFILVKM
jgi:RimJ/RimL family protein N-acetyltransferase